MESNRKGVKFQSFVEFWEYLPVNERILVDILRLMILKTIPETCREKLTYQVPFYYGKRRICMIWPASVPFGGIKSGVLLGFAQGNKLKDPHRYLIHGTNKQVYYKIFHNPDEIRENEIILLLNNAVALDKHFK